MAVSVNDVTGVFRGNLQVGTSTISNKEIYILPGVTANTVTLVLPSVTASATHFGDLVLTNIPMNTNGQLTLSNGSLYLRATSEQATVTSTSSALSSSSAQFTFTLSSSQLSSLEFNGSKVTDRNYTITNGGFEGSWSGNEPTGWHSFVSATGDYASFVTGNTGQFSQQTDVRPGSTGSYSACIQSKVTLGVKANGNCTNGRINAGSMSADDASGNYNFSDPSSTGYNTPFVGTPDSLVFWAKYVPGGGDVTDASNQARANVVVTTNARYQDPESSSSHASAKVAAAEINYSATSSKGWQRLSTPFTYTSIDPSNAAYILVTFSSNKTPGGGNATKKSPDNVYLDDVELVYNYALKSLTMNGSAISFSNGRATTSERFSESDYTFAATANGKGAQSFVGYDAQNNQVHVYVVANNYSQAGAYSVYTLQMAEPLPPIVDTEYAYSASTCDNEPYSDELFQNLTKAGVYNKTIPNTQGGDSLITLTLTILPTYSTATVDSIHMDESYTWQGREYRNLAPGMYPDTVTLKTVAGCDSLFTLMLKVKPIAYQFSDSATACLNEETTWHGKALPTGETGIYRVYDSLQTAYGTDSIYELKLTVLPTYLFTETRYVDVADLVWRGKTIQGLPQAQEPYLIYDSLVAANGCDSVYMLRLFVSDLPITYGFYEAAICQGEFVKYEGVKYTEAFEGDIHVSAPNVYGGDSIVHLTVVILPTYTIDEYQTITVGDDITWEGWNLSTMPEGNMTLNASYYTIDDCDSTLVLHLTVIPETEQTALDEIKENGREDEWLRVIRDGQLFIIRKEEMYNILGTKIQ